MRYAVGDGYARELATGFYRRLFANRNPKTAAQALNLGRRALLPGQAPANTPIAACDHATPLLYGAADPGLTPPNGRSPALRSVHPPLCKVSELNIGSHPHFVGRTWELADLGAGFIGTHRGGDTKPIALVTGLGGMGKTALAAEALDLWQARFDWVIHFQAKPNPLKLDNVLRETHLALVADSTIYRDHVTARPNDAIHIPVGEFTGGERTARLVQNLARALQDEAILLVIDNFETHLKSQSESGVWACADADWDACLGQLAANLPGSRSRVLITCRRPLKALPESGCVQIRLGPLPRDEAALLLRRDPALSALAFSDDPAERKLARRLLAASRFHPLLMNRLARLAAEGSRENLLQTLEALEDKEQQAQLPELFADETHDQKELDYLHDALVLSIDQLLAEVSPEARQLLWIVSLANDPVDAFLLQGVWSGEDHETEMLRSMKQLLSQKDQLPPEMAELMENLPPELQAVFEKIGAPNASRPELPPLLDQLLPLGLLESDRMGDDVYTCHELVRERIRAWITAHPADAGAFDETAIRLAYADQLIGAYQSLRTQNTSAALVAGSRALVYCVQAGDYHRLGQFASGVVTSSNDPGFLGQLMPHLETAAQEAPEGEPRWSCLTYLADALCNGGKPDASLAYYRQAEEQARAVAEAGGDDARQAWSDVATISGNWANAEDDCGDLASAKRRRLDSADADRKAGNPGINAIGSELEAYRIDIKQGAVAEALPEVERRLEKIEAWWTRHREGQSLAEAPDPETLARAYISGLDIAKDAHFATEDWPAALPRIDTIIALETELGRPPEDIASDQMNRAIVLARLRRFDEARSELEHCLEVFAQDATRRARVLSSLAVLFHEQSDHAKAAEMERQALAIRNELPDPADRAESHNNLANYLERIGGEANARESRRHQLASLIYHLVTGHTQHLQTSLRNYGVRFRRAEAAGTEFAVPRLADLLADPPFRPLRTWLEQRQEDTDELQAEIDQLLEQVRQQACSIAP